MWMTDWCYLYFSVYFETNLNKNAVNRSNNWRCWRLLMLVTYWLSTLTLWTIVYVSVVVGLDAELDESSVDDVTQCEDTIVSQSRDFLSSDSRAKVQKGLDEFNAILRRLGLKTRLVVLEKANSLALYFICLTLLALTRLRDQWSDGQLRDIVQSLFTLLSGASREVRIRRLLWSQSDYERSEEFLCSLPGKLAIQFLGLHFFAS